MYQEPLLGSLKETKPLEGGGLNTAGEPPPRPRPPPSHVRRLGRPADLDSHMHPAGAAWPLRLCPNHDLISPRDHLLILAMIPVFPARKRRLGKVK